MKNSTIPIDGYETEAKRITAYKKALYREKPTAKRLWAGNTNYQYYTETSIGTIFFEVPTKEMGDLPFGVTEQAQLLIRWIRI